MLRNWSLNPLAKVAIGILRKYGADAHVYMPGIGTVNGLTAGNYLDSAGTTAATVDNPVGLSLDALQAMTLGSELAPALSAGNGWTADADWSLGANQVSATAAGTGSGTYKALGTTNGNTYQVTFTLSGYASGSCYATLFNGVNGPAISANGTYTCTLTRNFVIDLAGVAAATANFTGTISGLSIKKIPGIHATQATTANKPILRLNSGKYSWQFDGSNDSLSLSAPLFQMSDDHAVIAGLNALRAYDYVLNFGSGASTQQVAAIYLSGSVVAASWVDNAATVSSVAEITPSLGVTKVACAVKISNAKRLRINGVQQGATDNAVRGATTVSAGFIGGFKSGSLPFSGSLYPVIAIKGTLSDSDLLVLERFVGQLSGVSI